MDLSPWSPDIFKARRQELAEVYRRGYKGLEEYAYTKPSDIKSYLQWLYRTDPEGLIVAQEDGKVVGFVAASRNWWDRTLGSVGEIHELVVLPEKQGRGIGSQLLEAALDFLSEYHDIFSLWVGEGNERARVFYQRRGFVPVGQMGKWIRMVLKKEQRLSSSSS